MNGWCITNRIRSIGYINNQKNSDAFIKETKLMSCVVRKSSAEHIHNTKLLSGLLLTERVVLDIF